MADTPNISLDTKTLRAIAMMAVIPNLTGGGELTSALGSIANTAITLGAAFGTLGGAAGALTAAFGAGVDHLQRDFEEFRSGLQNSGNALGAMSLTAQTRLDVARSNIVSEFANLFGGSDIEDVLKGVSPIGASGTKVTDPRMQSLDAGIRGYQATLRELMSEDTSVRDLPRLLAKSQATFRELETTYASGGYNPSAVGNQISQSDIRGANQELLQNFGSLATALYQRQYSNYTMTNPYVTSQMTSQGNLLGGDYTGINRGRQLDNIVQSLADIQTVLRSIRTNSTPQ